MMDFEPGDRYQPKKRRNFIKTLIYIVVIILGAGVALASWHFYSTRPTSPVPKNVQKAANFNIYYPDPNQLPNGYTLNTSSFKYISGKGVLYNVTYGSKKLVFTLQQKPSDSELSFFKRQYIPINRQVLTLVGTATEGAIGPQTVVSLPVDTDNVWIIVTGPADAYATPNLAQVLKAIRKS